MEDNVINVCIGSCYEAIFEKGVCLGFYSKQECEFKCKLYSCTNCHAKCPEILLASMKGCCPICEPYLNEQYGDGVRLRQRVLCTVCLKVLVNTKTSNPKDPWVEHQMHKSCWLKKKTKTDDLSSSSEESDNEHDKDYEL